MYWTSVPMYSKTVSVYFISVTVYSKPFSVYVRMSWYCFLCTENSFLCTGKLFRFIRNSFFRNVLVAYRGGVGACSFQSLLFWCKDFFVRLAMILECTIGYVFCFQYDNLQTITSAANNTSTTSGSAISGLSQASTTTSSKISSSSSSGE